MIAICKESSLPWRSSSKKNTALLRTLNDKHLAPWTSHVACWCVQVTGISGLEKSHSPNFGWSEVLRTSGSTWRYHWLLGKRYSSEMKLHLEIMNLMLMLMILDLFKEFTVSRCFEPCHTVWNMFCTFSKLLNHPRTFRHIIKCSVIAGLPNNILNFKQHSTVIWNSRTF